MPNNEHEICHYHLALTPELRANFKKWSIKNGVSMNTGICTLMETVTAEKKFKLQKRVLLGLSK